MDVEQGYDAYECKFAFSNKSIRRGFIRKVYGILIVQLAITFGLVAIFTLVEGAKTFSKTNPGFFVGASVVTLIIAIAMACSRTLTRRFPLNLIFLGIFTVCEGLLLGAIAATHEATEVLIATGICAVICLGLTIFAMQSKVDFTMLSGILFVLTLCLIIFGIMAAIWPSHMLRTVYSVLGAALFSVYIVVDTQLIMGNKSFAITPEEYVFAALNLYLDIINLFLFILRLISENK